MRAIELTKLRGAVKAKSSLSARGTIRKAQSRDFQSTSHRWEYTEHKCWDPKDGELCLASRNILKKVFSQLGINNDKAG